MAKYLQARPQKPKEFFREPKGTNTSPQNTQNTTANQEPQDTIMESDKQTLIESRKRKIIKLEP